MDTWCNRLITELKDLKRFLEFNKAATLTWYHNSSLVLVFLNLTIFCCRCCTQGHHILLMGLLAKPEMQEGIKRELLDTAVQEGHAHILAILFEKAMIPFARVDLCRWINRASEKGHSQALSILMCKATKPLDAEGPKVDIVAWVFMQALGVACRKGHVGIVKQL